MRMLFGRSIITTLDGLMQDVERLEFKDVVKVRIESMLLLFICLAPLVVKLF